MAVSIIRPQPTSYSIVKDGKLFLQTEECPLSQLLFIIVPEVLA